MNHTRWSTRAYQGPDRPAFWGQINQRYFGKLRVASLNEGPLDASLEAYNVGSLRIFRIEAPAHRVCRDATCGELPADEFYKLVLVVRGRALVEQSGMSAALEPGQWIQYDPRLPYAITAQDRVVLMVTQVPRQPLGKLPLGLLHTETGSSNRAGLHAVFGTYLCSLSDQLPALPDSVGTALSESVLGLLGTMLAEQNRFSGSPPAPPPAVLRLRVHQFVQANLSDPELSIPRIAGALRCSTRYLHRIFEDEDTSLERLIWKLRLERCHAALVHETSAGRTAAEISYAFGFKSSAHFTRLFKRHFGVTPGAVQHRAMLERAVSARPNPSHLGPITPCRPCSEGA